MTDRPPVRIIPRLDIKGPNVVKGIQLEGLRVVGKPGEMASKYYAEGADELFFIDIVASLYGRNNILDVVESAARDVFIPMTVGGGIRSLEDIKAILRSGADKVAINTAATKRPEFVKEAAEVFGSQCIVLSVEAKQRDNGRWEALTDNGREKTGLDVLEWVERAVALGAGEVLATSIDREGTRRGLDLDLARALYHKVNVPVIACGGVGSADDVAAVLDGPVADAVSCASIFHYGLLPLSELKSDLVSRGFEVRR
jgi:imidazole glycerol-phosphate synthase subunit HisF